MQMIRVRTDVLCYDRRYIIFNISISVCGHWGDPDVGGRIILRWIFRKLEGVVGTGWSWLRMGTGGGHL
jgi:hypothetical protein